MATSVILWMCITCFCYILPSVCADTMMKSKACFGNRGLHCAEHNITCRRNKTIAIHDAYYTNNRECKLVGISNCVSLNPNTLKEHGYQRFNHSEMKSLYKTCSMETQCAYLAPRRRNPALTLSVVTYICLDRQKGSNTGAIVGGVVATVVAALVVTLVSVWIIRRRRTNSEVNEKTSSLPKDAKPDMIYSLAGNITQNRYHEIQTPRPGNGEYDYATADGMVLPPTTNTYIIIEPGGKLRAGDNSKVSAAEGDYDHLGDKQPPQTSDYDTTASVAPPGYIGEDGYGYNHFQKKANPQTNQNDYDTAASATKPVAQISTTERNTDEDDYDHFQRDTNASETVSSPYDTTSGITDNPDFFCRTNDMSASRNVWLCSGSYNCTNNQIICTENLLTITNY